MLRRIAMPLLAASLALTACSEEQTEVTEEDVDRIEQSIINASALSWELIQAESRVASMCMQDGGFSVHDPVALFGNGVPGRFEGFASPYTRIPNVEQAQKFGFGEWVRHGGDDEAVEAMRDDPDFKAFNAVDEGWWDPAWDTAREEFDAMGEEYEAEWRKAFEGVERYEYGQAFQQAMDEGEDPMDFDTPEPPFGGCELETIEIVYGGPEKQEMDDGEEVWVDPGMGESPLSSVGDGAIYNEMSAEYIDKEQAFLDCIEARGFEGWEFDETTGWLPTGDFLGTRVYGDTTQTIEDGEVVEYPELPDGAEDLEPKEFEFAMALDFAECAEEAGLRGGTEDTFARLYVEKVIDQESEIFAYEQQIEAYLANAQDYLAGE
jgi:hypothetical protein